jgi:hypothetical protein
MSTTDRAATAPVGRGESTVLPSSARARATLACEKAAMNRASLNVESHKRSGACVLA